MFALVFKILPRFIVGSQYRFYKMGCKVSLQHFTNTVLSAKVTHNDLKDYFCVQVTMVIVNQLQWHLTLHYILYFNKKVAKKTGSTKQGTGLVWFWEGFNFPDNI